MKRHLSTACALALVLCAGGGAVAQQKATAQNVPEIPFTSVPNFLKLPPGEYLGESVAVATNSKGHIFVYHRSANTRLFEFDQNGNFLKEIGKGYYGFEFAHSVRVDHAGQHLDRRRRHQHGHQVQPRGQGADGARPPAAGRRRARSRRRPDPNQPAQKYIFCRPTDVGWDPQGNIFVSDGYCNNRVVKYDKDGRFLAQVGSEKAGKEPGEFNLAARTAGRRQGQRLGRRSHQHPLPGARQQSEAEGDLRPTSASAGRSAFRRARTSICSPPTPIPNGNAPGSWDITGEIYKMELDGTILGKFGHAGKEFAPASRSST